MTTKDALIKWTTSNYSDSIIFSRVIEIYKDIERFTENNNLETNKDTDEFLIKLIEFLYNNSSAC